MRRTLLAIAILVSGLVSAQQNASYPPAVTTKTLYAKNDYRGKPAPAFTFGTWLKNAAPDTKGKVVLIDFWATWCPPCRALIPELNGFQKKFKDDLVVIRLSDEATDTVKKFMEGTAMEYSVASDPAQTMSSLVGVKGIPHVLVITPDGIVLWQGFPLDDQDRLTEDKLGQIIAASKVKS